MIKFSAFLKEQLINDEQKNERTHEPVTYEQALEYVKDRENTLSIWPKELPYDPAGSNNSLVSKVSYDNITSLKRMYEEDGIEYQFYLEKGNKHEI